MGLSKLLNVVTDGFLWQCTFLYLLRSIWRCVKTECQTAKTAVSTGGGKSGGKPVPVYPLHQLRWKHHLLLSHATDETAVDVLMYTIACCLGMCHAAAQHLLHCSMALGGHRLENTRGGFCVPMEKPFLCSGLLFAQEKHTECLQVRDAELSCCVVGTTPCKILWGRRQAGNREGGGGLK